ncbi:MAG: outer membrane beta-barrel protein [Ignavibacteria bacterium]|nr:outer membrane beta-barrel protein [Ignavibacteria bacterium]MBT8383141.1 outer membrane beta-barrel protein [Ignavibacteria bacterium]MBT8391311.1 outer membrane beta-barrel protein [Ignavibacteria bacterium]NNJ53009.1 outer membrane beta-barrel protein [Ignavibacteriaceae bacterium]NNL22629.1 outer membrane beta-barrel protein [Ignavibacteriaceae bacterium]
MKSFYSFLILSIISTTVIYSQPNLDIALQKGGWTGGLAGWVGWENFKTDVNVGENSNINKVDGFNFIFSSRNGSIVETNGVFGFDFQWREKSRTTKPDPNPSNLSEYEKERVWFLGLWARYYFRIGGNFAFFIEGSGGYAVFNRVTESVTTLEQSTIKLESSANGFAYNGGIGFSHFISPNAAFEVTGRYEGGSLNGDRKSPEKNDLNIKLGNIFILFGFQVYLL